MEISYFHFILLYCTICVILKLKIIFLLVISITGLEDPDCRWLAQQVVFEDFCVFSFLLIKFTAMSSLSYVWQTWCCNLRILICIVCSFVYLTSRVFLIISCLKSGNVWFTSLFIWYMVHTGSQNPLQKPLPRMSFTTNYSYYNRQCPIRINYGG